MRVSVIVPVYNGEATIGALLESLATQTLGKAAYEVIVVDDASTDGTVRLVEQRPGVRLVARPVNGGPAAARNDGLRAASAPVIAFTDADCVVAPDWLERGLARLDAEPGLAGVEGRTDPIEEPGTLTHQMRNVSGGLWMTCNAFYRREVIERAGGFDERFRMAFLEDSDLAFTVMEQGGAIAWDRSVVVRHQVIHEGRRKFWRDARKRFYNPLLYRKHPQAYRTHLRPVVPGLPELHVAWMLASIATIVLALTRVWLAVVPAAAVAAFYLRRLMHAYRARDVGSALQVAAVPFVQTFWVVRGAARFRAFSRWL